MPTGLAPRSPVSSAEGAGRSGELQGKEWKREVVKKNKQLRKYTVAHHGALPHVCALFVVRHTKSVPKRVHRRHELPYTPSAFLSSPRMKASVSALSVAMLLATASHTALAQTTTSPQFICSNRLSGLEKAQCLVQQRNEILRQLGLLPPTPRSSTQSSEVGSISSESVASSPTAFPTQPRSCSRMNGREKALCLVEQRKEVLRQLANRPPVASLVTVPIPKAPVKANCTRLRDPVERTKCHSGNRIGTSSSSASSQ